MIGRESGHYTSDISLGHNNFVSRAHLELTYITPDGWHAACNGKNGILIDEILLKKADLPKLLPDKYEFFLQA